MNSRLRISSTFILAVVSFALAALCLGLSSGWGRTVEWSTPTGSINESEPAAAVLGISSLALDSIASTWQKPLFNPSRQPEAITPVNAVAINKPSLEGWSVTGIVLSANLHMALLKQADGPALKVLEGAQLANGWTVTKIDGRQVTFIYGTDREVLLLPAYKSSASPGF